MKLLKGVEERLARETPTSPTPGPRPALPKADAYYAGRTTFVTTAEGAKSMTDLASQRPLSHIAVDTEFKHDRPGVVIDRHRTAHDPRSVRPLLLSLTMAEPVLGDATQLSTFVVDLRRPEVLPSLRGLLLLSVLFVAHYFHAELICFFQLGLPEPRMLWDTWACEKVLHLGRRNKRYHIRPGADEAEAARIGRELEEEEELRLSLVATCRRRGIEYPFAGDKERLRRSFLDLPDDAEFTPEQIDYAAADAQAAARLYLPQVVAAARGGVLHHLMTVEMRWTAPNARMVWTGVRVDDRKAGQVLDACRRHEARLAPRLATFGITKPRSHPQLVEAFSRLGVLDLFRRDGGYSFDKEQLDTFADRHEAIALVRAARRVTDLQSDRLLTGEFIGIDGRVHPEHRQLGADSGRQSCRWPNILGIGKVFRPLIVPEPGRGIGEADWRQIEIGLAATVYGDADLIKMFNTGDAYSAMAQDFFRDRLSESERNLPGIEFKESFPALRDRMKSCTLAMLYGVTAHGLARQLGTSVREAANLLQRFLAMFPELGRALREVAALGAIRGFAPTVSGLRRYRGGAGGPLRSWERNWMLNHPVQGSAAVVFKAAGIRLDQLYRRHDAWLIVALHDAFIWEAPLGEMQAVAKLTESVMIEVVRDYFPELNPGVELNVGCPGCWNKARHADSVERWTEDPTFSL